MLVRAAVLRDKKGPFTIEDLTLDEPGPQDILIRVCGVGLCHTDLLPRVTRIGLPIVCGHEGSGGRRGGGLRSQGPCGR